MLLKSSNQKDDSSNQDNTQESFYTGESDREDHLIDWVVNLCYESQNVPPNLTIHSIYLSNSLSYIMHQMCPEQFTMQLSITELETLFIDFFFKQYGFYVKPLLSVESKKQIMMIKLVLYACIYSQQKEKFVSNILKLPSQTQEKIVAEIQKVQSQLKHLKNWDRMIEIMKQLEAENNQLTDLLNKAEVQAEEYQSVIKAMSQELEETKKQRNLYIVEKRKLLSNFELSSFAEYQDLCTKLQVENESLTNRQKQLLKVINEMEEETYQLHKELHNSDIVITELNKQYVNLQRNYLDMTKQVSNSQDNNHIHTQQTLHEIKSKFSSKFITKAIQITDKVSSKKVSIIHKKKPSGLQNLACDIFEKIEQNIGRSGRSSARNLFNTTKNIVQLNQRINDYEEMLEQQKHHLIELQNQIAIYENKQRFYLKKIRKIQRISDCFSMEYDNIIDSRFKVVHFQPQLQHV